MPSNQKISEIQLAMLSKAIDTTVDQKSNVYGIKNKSKYYVQLLSTLCNTFEIDSIKDLRKTQCNEVLSWLHNYNRVSLQNTRRKIKSSLKYDHDLERINTLKKRAKQDLGMNQAKVLNFAFHNLQLSERVYSFDRLTETQLYQLEEALFKI